MPTEAEEVWRYSRISEFSLDAYAPSVDAADGGGEFPGPWRELAQAIGERAGVVLVHNGRIVHVEVDATVSRRGVEVGDVGSLTEAGELIGSVAGRPDVFSDLNLAFLTGAVLVRVPPGVAVEHPLLVFHWIDGEGLAACTRTVVQAGDQAQVTVLEHLGSPDVRAYVNPIVELDLAPASNVRYVTVQDLGPRVWQTGYQAARVGRDATLVSAAIALGGDYARTRIDAEVTGQGGESRLFAVYFSDGTQTHDFRTLQDQAAPRGTTNLLFKGAVADEANAVYSGLIRVRRGAVGTEAFLTNRNLLLSEKGHVDSVPNLEIVENDLRSCGHAAATGPIDEEQRYYLESRGVPTQVADRLIVLGFFDEVLEQVPVRGVHPLVRSRVAAKLEHALPS